MSTNNPGGGSGGGASDEKQARGFTRRKQHEFERRTNNNGDATPPAAHSRELSLEAGAEDDANNNNTNNTSDTTTTTTTHTNSNNNNNTNATSPNSSETRSLTSTAGQPITLQDLLQQTARPRLQSVVTSNADLRSSPSLAAASASVPLPPPMPPPPAFPPTSKKGAALALATNETRERSHSTDTETTWLVRHRSKSHKKVKARPKDGTLAASASAAVSKSAMARADDERPKSPPPLPPASDAVDSAAGADVVPLPPTPKAAGEPAAAPDRERRRKKKADPLHLDVDDAAPLKRNSSQGDLPGVYAAGAGGTARSRAESDNVPHAPPAAVVLESHAAAASAGQMSDKRQFLTNFLRSRPPASQIAALAAESGGNSPSLSSPKRKGLTRVDGGPIAPPLGHAASEASLGSPLTTSSSTSSTSVGNLLHRSPRSSPSPPPLPMHRVDRGGDPSPRSPHDLSPRSGSPALDHHANKGGVSITRLTGFQRNPEAVRAMLAAAGVDPESVPSSKARPSASAAPAQSPDATHAAGVRRLRSVTYVRTTAIEAPIRKILQSGRFTIDVPRFERMMGDEVVYVVQITSRGGGDLGPAGWNWLVRHKFTAFANLHVILKGLRVVRDMPKFPRKGIALYTSQAMLEKRCQKLAEYLTALARTPIGRSSTFIDFLRPTKAAVYNPSGQIANVESSDDESPTPPAPLRSTSPALPATSSGGGGGSPNKMPPKPKGVAPQPGSAVKSRHKEKSSNKLSLSGNAPLVTSSLSSSGARVANGGAMRSDSSGPSPPPVPSTPPPGSVAPPTPSTPPPTAASTSDREDGSEDADNLALNESSGADAQADLTTAVREANALRRSAAQRPETLSLDDFEIIKLIGVGGFGKVFLCKKRSTGEILALKRLRKKLIEAKGQSAHVRTEKEVLEFTRALGNDSWLTRLFYSFETPDYLCLAMEYVPGGDLRIILDDFGVLDDEYARFYFCEMVMCVNTLHKLGYIHRDLKPANFLIDGHGHLKLGDFGLSKGADAANPRASVVVNRRLKAYSVVGTPQYMAKETLTGGGYDASVDWWALGCVARGTPVALADGTARTIEDAVALANGGALELVSVEADQRTLIARCNAGKCSGVKSCVRVALVDGRALELTPDHRVLTATRGWVEAAQLAPSDRVVVPLLETPLDVVTADEVDWSHGNLAMACSRSRQQALALARLAGRGGRDVEQACDRAAVVRDDVIARGAIVSSAAATWSASALVPAFVAGAPRAVKREFLAALFGTGAAHVARNSVSLTLASVSCARDVARLLDECGVDMRGHTVNARRLRLSNVLSFAEQVGVRYCARRQRQLASACLLARCDRERIGAASDVVALLTKARGELPSTVALRVADVRACGKRETFDLSVPGSNAFVAGGVTVHNCILYEMLVGEPPFSGETADEIFEQVRNFGDAFQRAIASSAGKADSPLSPGAGQVVLKLICDTSVRLGDEQVEDIKALPWFESVDWNNLREAEPPFIPQLESAEDTTYFEGAKDRAETDPDKSIDRRVEADVDHGEADDE